MMFEKELTRANLGVAGMNDRYVTIPKTQIDPEQFFGLPPLQVNVIDYCSGIQYELPYKKEANGEYRLYRLGTFFDQMSADVGDIMSFQKDANGVISVRLIRRRTRSISDFPYDLCSAGLMYNRKLVSRFIASLLAKPFVILTGLSGSGKTKLAQAFAQWICRSDKQYRIIPVGADWTNREPLLGYPNALKEDDYVKPESGVLDLIIQANENPDIPFFLILDEMNLSHVERYFSDFLSVMESQEKILLHPDEKVKNGVPSKLGIPSNLFVIGTVNIDETTYMFSPKVLDRASTIEFRLSQAEMKNYLANNAEVKSGHLNARGSDLAKTFLDMSSVKELMISDVESINEVLLGFHSELKKTGAEFGYRSAREILRLIHQLTVVDERMTTDQKIDYAIMQKLLPKVHGSRRKLVPVLEKLATFCVSKNVSVVIDVFEKAEFDFNGAGVIYPVSLEKITRMYHRAIENGFASFAEA